MKKTILISILFCLLSFPILVNAEHLFLGPSDFALKKSHTDAVITTEAIYIESWSIDNSFTFSAPVHLPEGANIKAMAIFFKDNQSTARIDVEMIRHNRYQGTTQTIIPKLTPPWSTTDGAADLRNYKISYITTAYSKIYNGSFTYHVKIDFVATGGTFSWSDLKLYGIKIFYDPPTP